nr:branched-chain amino acid ABC transporter permease [Rhizobium sp. RHZ02]
MTMKLSSKTTTLLVLTLVVVALPFLFPSSYYFRVGSLIFVNGLAVTGLVILTGYAGQISLGHAGFVGIGGYSCALAPLHIGLHPALAVILGAVLSALVAWLVGRPILRLKGYYLAVASLGLGALVAMVLANEAGWTGGPDGIAVADLGLRGLLKSLGLDMSNPVFWYAFTGFIMLIGAWLALNLFHSPTGRALRALHGSEVAARTVGVDVAKYKLRAFVISAVYASVAGSLLALQNKFITPDVAGYMHSIELVTMAVLGGAGSVVGAILGAAILTTLPQVLTVFQEYEQLVLGLIMMLVMIFMRDGLLPSLARLIRGRGE